MRADGAALRCALVCCAALLCAGRTAAGAPLIWQLEGEANTIWLMGSVHVLREDDYPLPAVYDQVYAAADSLVMELDLDDLHPLEAQRALTARGRIASNDTLADLIGAEAWAAATMKARAIGIDIRRLAAIEPWYAALTVVQQRLLALGYDPAFGVDAHYAATAAAEGKPVQGLETVDEQLAILDGMSPAMQSDFLLQALDDAAGLDGEIEGMLAAWKSGDAAHLEETLLTGLKAFPALYEQLVVERNRRWAEKIAGFRRRPDDVLLIVGALHLVGADSVVKMLRKQGFEVRRMRATGTGNQISIISKSSLPAPQSGQRHDSGTSSQRVRGGMPDSGSPFSSS